MIPIILPIVMIIINTVANSVMGEAEPEIFKFIGDKTTALLTGAIAAYIIAVKSMGREKAEKAATEFTFFRRYRIPYYRSRWSILQYHYNHRSKRGNFRNCKWIDNECICSNHSCISCRFTDQTGNRFRNSICNHKYDNYVKCRSGSCTSTSIYCNGMFVWYIIWCDS